MSENGEQKLVRTQSAKIVDVRSVDLQLIWGSTTLNSLKGVAKDGSGNQKGKVVGRDFYVEVRFLPASRQRAP